MLHKVFPQKRSSRRWTQKQRKSAIRAVFKYLLNQNRSVPPRILRGYAKAVIALVDAHDFAEPFTSFVLSFEELIGDEKANRIIDDYEKVAFAGIDQNDIMRVWIVHEDHGRTELHCVVANVHLTSGKNWKHYYYLSDFRLFKSFQELINIRFGFSSPDDPARKKIVAQEPKGLSEENAHIFELVDHAVTNAVLAGDVTSQSDITKLITDLGYDAKGNKYHVRVREKDSNERGFRLNGAKYHRDFFLPEFLSKIRYDAQKFNDKKRKHELEVNFLRKLRKRRNRMLKRFSNEQPEKVKGRTMEKPPEFLFLTSQKTDSIVGSSPASQYDNPAQSADEEPQKYWNVVESVVCEIQSENAIPLELKEDYYSWLKEQDSIRPDYQASSWDWENALEQYVRKSILLYYASMEERELKRQQSQDTGGIGGGANLPGLGNK